ncbi:hypothetical protein [Aeromicrobium sp. 179-A 4D2 NHS]
MSTLLMDPPAPPLPPTDTTVKQDEHNPFTRLRDAIEAARSLRFRQAFRR